MAERQKVGLETILEKKADVPLPSRTCIWGIYREKKRLVVRRFEEIEGIRVCLDEEYALNEDDAIIILNIMYHKTFKFSLN